MVGQTFQQAKRSREKRKKKGEVNKTKGKKERRKGVEKTKQKGGGGALLMNPLPDRSTYSPLCHTHYLTTDQYFIVSSG